MTNSKTLQVVMLPTNEKSKLVLSYCKELAINWTHDLAKFDDATYQHLYILSDEEIKKGDWVYRDTGTIFQMTKELSEYYKSISNTDVHKKYKIIATTDKSLMYLESDYSCYLPQPSQSFIEHFVEEYNKGNVITEVEVEYNEIVVFKQVLNEGFGSYYHKEEPEFVLEINPDNTINILTKKDSWSREEVIELIKKFTKDNTVGFIVWVEDFDSWFEKNL